jgi:hypothetical protein
LRRKLKPACAARVARRRLRHLLGFFGALLEIFRLQHNLRINPSEAERKPPIITCEKPWLEWAKGQHLGGRLS